MAFLDAFKIGSEYSYFKLGFFNVTQAVGANEVGTGKPAVNLPTDMMLVYYLIWFLYRKGNKAMFKALSTDKFNDPNSKDYNSPEMRQKLPMYIRRIQTDLKGRKSFVDGRCDKAKGVGTAMTHSIFLIHNLNYYYADTVTNVLGRRDWQTFLIEDPMTPRLLSIELRNSIKPI